MDEPRSKLSMMEPLQAVAVVVTLGTVLGGGFMAFGVLKAVGESNREDILDFRNQWTQAWQDQKASLRAIDERMRTNEVQLAELRAIIAQKQAHADPR